MAWEYDLIIKNGLILDGGGNETRSGDVAVANGLVAATGPDLNEDQAGQIIDAAGAIICPGFIDAHSHDDLTLLLRPDGREKLLQGVTSTVTGNCGQSAAPVAADDDDWLALHAYLGADQLPGGRPDFDTFGSYLDRLEAAGPGLNVIPLVGHSTIRTVVMGLAGRKAETEEINRMKELIADALAVGARGLSSGVFYPPGSYADSTELIQLAETLQGSGGVYTAHIRNEREMILSAMSEAVDAGRLAMVPVHLSHHKVAGENNWGRTDETLAMIEAWRDGGVPLTIDQYPYSASATGLASLLPPHFLSGGPADFGPKLRDAKVREQLRAELTNPDITEWENMIKGASFDSFVVSALPGKSELVGRSLADIAAGADIDPLDLVFDLVADHGWDAGIIAHSMSEEDIRTIMTKPYTAICTDGTPNFPGRMVHPRLCGSFPRVLGRYVRELGVLDLPEAVRKMTSLPASIFGLTDRGVLEEGKAADLVIFDPQTIIDRADYGSPLTPPQGISHVIVNGQLAVSDGQLTANRAGKVLRG